MASVLHIFICADKGLPMEERKTIQALEGVGLEGDRYATGKGAYSNSKRVTIRQVSLIEIEKFNDANNELEDKFTLAETRRNIVAEGVDLNALVGKEFSIGSVRFKGIELCTPCARPSQLANKKDFLKAFENRGGLRAEVLNTGFISVGDEIKI